jgi:hypothetical protein
MTRIALGVAATLAALAACAQDIRFVPGQGSSAELTDVERGAAQLAIDTLASDLGIAPDSIEVDTVKAIEWRDSSLGCPKPGVAYLDVVTPGHKVILRVGLLMSPARGPWIWCDMPPVPKITTFTSSSQLSTAFLMALPS